MRLKKLIITLFSVVLVFSITQTSHFSYLDTLSAELSLILRALVHNSPDSLTRESPVVVVAIDEKTYVTPPFVGTPKVMWTPQLAQVQDAILDAGAKVVGYDIIFPTSIEQFIPGYERGFLRSLAQWGRQGKIVLGQAQHSENPIAPYPAQLMVAGGGKNLRALNLLADSDEVVRRLPLSFETQDGTRVPSMSLELAMRANITKLELLDNGSVIRQGELVEGSDRQKSYLNFYKGAGIPTFSLADLFSCAEAKNTDFFESYFKDKVVIFGLVLDLEDRKLTSKRFFNNDSNYLPSSTCISNGSPAFHSVDNRDTLPGVYIHAQSATDLINGSSLSRLDGQKDELLTISLIIAGAVIGLMTTPLLGGFLCFALIALILVADQYALAIAKIIPTLPMIGSLLASYILMAFVEYNFTRKKQAKTRKLFALYLDKSVIDKMLESDQAPELGGEKREVTIWFSDIADFTSISERLTPNELVDVMNLYFTAVTRLIEEHGGFVDKYIGDAIVGVFGAPLQDDHHASHAVSCALQAQKLLAKMNNEGAFGDLIFQTRIGINTGQVLVGNIGSEDRFNYTVMGDEVNLASRLEGVNKVFGSQILIAGRTADRLPKTILTRPLIRLRVKGKSEAVKVAEPIDMQNWNLPVFRNSKIGKHQSKHTENATYSASDSSFEASQKIVDSFTLAYDAWQHGKLDEAREIYQKYSSDKVAKHMLQLLEIKASTAGTFDPILNLDSK